MMIIPEDCIDKQRERERERERERRKREREAHVFALTSVFCVKYANNYLIQQ